MQYIPINQRKMRRVTKAVAIIAGIGLTVSGIVVASIYSGMVGVVVLAAAFFKKEIVLSEAGIVVTYRLGRLKTEEVWGFEEIESVHIEARGASKLKALHFKKGVLSKILIFPADDLTEILQFIKQSNPEIFFREAN